MKIQDRKRMDAGHRSAGRLVCATRIALRHGWWLGWIAAAFFLALLTIERRGHENTADALMKAWHALEERGAK